MYGAGGEGDCDLFVIELFRRELKLCRGFDRHQVLTRPDAQRPSLANLMSDDAVERSVVVAGEWKRAPRAANLGGLIMDYAVHSGPAVRFPIEIVSSVLHFCFFCIHLVFDM